MDDITKASLKSKLPDYVNSITQATPKAGRQLYVCPLCNSGTGPNATGAFSLDEKSNLEKWHCFACGQGGDIFDLIGAVQGVSDPSEQFKLTAEMYGQNLRKLEIQNSKIPDAVRPETGHTSTERPKFDPAKYIMQCAQRISQTDYLKRRGFNDATIKRFNLGYDPEAWLGKDIKGPAIIIPCQPDYFLRRSLDPAVSSASKYLNMAGRSISADCFLGIQYLTENSAEPVFIVEGALNAISLEQVGVAAISANSHSNYQKLISYIKEHTPTRPIIVAFDPDEKAQFSQAILLEALQETDQPCIGFDFSTETAKDPNDLLQLGFSVLEAAINTAKVELDIKAKEATAKEAELLRLEQEAYNKTKATVVLSSFLDFIEFGTNNKQIPTGFKQLDKVLDGGFTGGSLICMGGLSSLGKTSLAAQIADQIAAQGQDVLFFTLEMPQFELISKSISRYTYELAGNADPLYLTARQIMRYKTWAKNDVAAHDKLSHILKSAGEYAEQIGGFLHYNEGLKGDFRPFTATDIEHAVSEHIRLTGNAPVVFVDYLQILGAINEHGSDKQNTDMNVTILKRIARQHDIPLVVVSALNRENYKNEISMAAFKESGIIEYSSDILFGMQPRLKEGEERAKFDIDAFKSQEVREIEVKILKNRNGISGGKIHFDYRPAYNHFGESNDNPLNFFRAGRQKNYI